jgi:hypothetical protein
MRIWRWAWNIGTVIILCTSGFAQSPPQTSGTAIWSTASSLVLTPKSPEGNKRVEKLTSTEVKAIHDADAELAAAEAKHDAIIDGVKKEHGASECPDARWLVVCTGYTTVTLWGENALIETITIDYSEFDSEAR